MKTSEILRPHGAFTHHWMSANVGMNIFFPGLFGNDNLLDNTRYVDDNNVIFLASLVNMVQFLFGRCPHFAFGQYVPHFCIVSVSILAWLVSPFLATGSLWGK